MAPPPPPRSKGDRRVRFGTTTYKSAYRLSILLRREAGIWHLKDGALPIISFIFVGNGGVCGGGLVYIFTPWNWAPFMGSCGNRNGGIRPPDGINRADLLCGPNSSGRFVVGPPLWASLFCDVWII